MDSAVETYLNVLDPQEFTTGGGSASALAGAMAASLAAMAARLSIGKEGMQPESFYHGLISQLESLSAELLQGARDDSGAFQSVRDAYQLPKASSDEKTWRSKAIQEARMQAASVPMANAEACLKVLQLVSLLEGRSNPNLASDLECAGHLSRAGLLGCLANVETNIPSIKDAAVTQELAARINDIRHLMRAVD